MNHPEPSSDQNEAESLLQACAACGTVIDVSDEEPLSPLTCPACGAEQTVSGTVDHFELQEVVGQGGMGVVYRAYDAGLERFVALKLLRRDKSANQQIVEQLEKEAAITASINHPHVVRVFTSGTDHQRFYIVMELVDKGTLDDLIKLQGHVAEAQVLEVGIQIAQGLRAALQAGLIHRDVKPGNILFGDAHTAKIVDFGLAIFMEDEEASRGEVWGTPYYVAPEKLDQQPEDFRSDIYSLGGTLFHALAGRPPFEAENASLVALKHLKSQAVSLQAFAPYVSSETAYVINRTLCKDPNDRYQSYDELIEHLEYALEHLKEKGANPQAQRRVVLENEASQKAMGWVSLVMFLLIGAVAVTGFIFRKQIFPQGEASHAPATPALNAPLAKSNAMFPEARALLVAGDVEPAVEAYHRAAVNPKLPPLQAAWAGIGEGLGLMSVGRLSDAQNAFRLITDRGHIKTESGDEGVATFLSDTASKLVNPLPIPATEAKGFDHANFQAIGLLLYGLKDWDLDRFDEAAALFREFRQTTPAGRDAWIGELKPLVTDFMEKYAAYQMAVDQVKGARRPDKRAAGLAALRKLKGPFVKIAEGLEKTVPIPKVPQLPALGDWSQTILGEPEKDPSGAVDASSVFTLKAAGIDLWGNTDSGYFLQRPLEGDGELVVHVSSLEKGDGWSKAGPMLRESLKPEARNVAVLLTGGNGVAQQARAQTNSATVSVKSTGAAPQWLKLSRKGDVITGFRSADGQDWTKIAEHKLDKLPPKVFLGIAVSSHNTSGLVTAKCDSVTFTKAE